MKSFLRFGATIVFLFYIGIQGVSAQSMEQFFSYKSNEAYWWLSKFAHPMNIFRSGYWEMYGDNVYVTINSNKYTSRFRIHKNGAVFDSIETLEDTDWATAFHASDIAKDILLSFWRDYSSDTVEKIERIFGNLDNIGSKQMCLAVLTALFWKCPSNPSVSSSNSFSGNKLVKLYGYVGDYPITMSITFKRTYVEGSYYYNRKGPDNVLSLLGTVPTSEGLMLLNETDEFGQNTGRFIGTYSNGVFQGRFHTQRGRDYPFRVYIR